MNPAELLVRARRSVASATLLLEAGDRIGACNRAYYAMFDAARAALLAAVPRPQSESIKTHSGLHTAFSLHFIRSGLIPARLGKSLNHVDQIRLMTDYSDLEIDGEKTASALEQAEQFVEAIAKYVGGLPS